MNFIQALTEADRMGCGCRPIGTKEPVYGIKGHMIAGVSSTAQGIHVSSTVPNSVKLLLGPWELVNPPKPKDCLTALFAKEIAEATPPADCWSLSRLVSMICPFEPKARELRLADLL